ncbi:MAG: Bax inhibitor-1 family protein [Pseudobacteriovorax sp.]|nr:Bax inhibitor-1 family protein [Pseudobacteriovorax sp.]
MNTYSSPVAHSSAADRASFIRKTYFHVMLAILAFTGIEVFLFQSGLAPVIASAIMSVSWLLVIVGIMLCSWIATRLASSAKSAAVQYAGLGLLVFAYAIMFVPLLYIVEQTSGGGTIESAAIATLAGTAGLTAIVFATGADFSWLGKFLAIGAIGILALIVCSVLFGFSLGVLFSVGMIVFTCAAILYDTSNILHHYSEDQYVAAALQLFASVAMLFWYVLSFLNSRD